MRISVVIPVLDEAERLPRLLATLTGLVDVVVVDGGSRDGTPALAEAGGARVIVSAPGRGRQMNAGAAAAQGEVLWFLHGDCLPHPDAAGAITRALADPGVVGGCFRLQFDAAGLGYRALGLASTLRARWTGTLYGDQGLFMRREAFDAAGGFPDQPLMEDHVLSRRLGSLGRLAILPLPMLTSARRFQRFGLVRTVWRMQVVKLLYALGVPLPQIVVYYQGRGRSGA